MKRFRSRLTEDLNAALVEPTTPAAKQAKQLGLQYVGFGRYEDPRTGQVSHIVQNDRLVPFQAAMKTNTYQQQQTNDIGNFTKSLDDNTQQLNTILSQAYPPEAFSEDELDAIAEYTDSAFFDINDKLYSMPLGVSADEIVPQYNGDMIPEYIRSLDNAIAKTQAPDNFVVYTALGKEYKLDDFAMGSTFAFKGYRSTTINPSIALNYNPRVADSGAKRTIYALQINVPAGAQGIYAEDVSRNPGENEFILPRGSKVRVIDGPNKFVGSNAQFNTNSQEVYFYNCELILE
jgi:hypothetical protein